MNKFSYIIIAAFAVIEITSIVLFSIGEISSKNFLISTAVCVTGVLAKKLSIDKRNKLNSIKD